MALYLDSANIEEARRAKKLGWVYGVTTNPNLMAKAGIPPREVLVELAALDFHQVYYQLVSRNMDAMLEEAHQAAELVRSGLVLKVVPTEIGYRFVSEYNSVFSFCITAVYDAAQALVAREAGARYIAVYVNRATKQIGDGISLVRELAEVLSGGQTRIVAASLKSTKETAAASMAGAQDLTVPFDVLMALVSHPLSEQTIEQFNIEGVGI